MIIVYSDPYRITYYGSISESGVRDGPTPTTPGLA